MPTEWLNYPRTNYLTLPSPFNPLSSSLFTAVFQHNWALRHRSSVRIIPQQSQQGSWLSVISPVSVQKWWFLTDAHWMIFMSSLQVHSTIWQPARTRPRNTPSGLPVLLHCNVRYKARQNTLNGNFISHKRIRREVLTVASLFKGGQERYKTHNITRFIWQKHS